MKSIETQGKTVDQAIELGLYKLETTRDKVKISILEEAGLFNKARVKITLDEASETENQVKTLVEELLNKMNLELDVTVEEQEEQFLVDVTGKDAALIIGKRGESLDAFSFLVNNIYNKGKKHEDYKKVIVDSNNYKAKREDTLKILAERMAAKAVRENHDVRMEPMNANERRLIHSALSEHSKVETESQGNEPNRYVVIKLKNKNAKKAETENRSYNY